MLRILFIVSLFLSNSHCQAQDDYLFEDHSYTIVFSSKKYANALKIAKKASAKLTLEMDLGNNTPSKKEGLTNNSECNCGTQHGYIPRGKGGEGSYVSIEYTDAFQDFSKGYYIVVVQNGMREDLQSELLKIQTVFADAYRKTTQIYIGCMH